MPDTKHYIGDGVYADYDGYALILTAENGLAITNRIVLEPEVFTSLVQYVERLVEQQRPDTTPPD